MSHLSNEAQVKASEEFLNKININNNCSGCQRGINMCLKIPCLGTVEDIEKLIDAGYAKNLMLDYWSGRKGDTDQEIYDILTHNPFKQDVFYLLPAIEGLEGKQAGYSRSGKCNLLIDNQCSLHNSGLKPTQGKIACCKINNVYTDSKGKQRNLDERIPILYGWNTQRGLDLIERWKKEVNFQENNENSSEKFNPNDIIGSLDKVIKAYIEAQETDRLLNINTPEPENVVEVKYDNYELIKDIK